MRNAPVVSCRTFIKLLNASEAHFVGAEVVGLLLGLDRASFPIFKDDLHDVFAFGILCHGGAHECLQQYLLQNEGYSVSNATRLESNGCTFHPDTLNRKGFNIVQTVIRRANGTQITIRSVHDSQAPSLRQPVFKFRCHVYWPAIIVNSGTANAYLTSTGNHMYIVLVLYPAESYCTSVNAH
jgi:hypothetical protein